MRKIFFHSFEDILTEFQNYIEEDDICTVISTPPGYTVKFWDDLQNEWYNITFCRTPSNLKKVLHNHRKEFESYKASI